MKKALFALMIVSGSMCFLAKAQAQETFKLQVSLSAKQVSEEERLKDHCYQFARQGEEVRVERKKASWAEATPGTEYVWRITQLSSGLVCRELVEGTNNRQFGPSSVLEGCNCKGEIEVLK